LNILLEVKHTSITLFFTDGYQSIAASVQFSLNNSMKYSGVRPKGP